MQDGADMRILVKIQWRKVRLETRKSSQSLSRVGLLHAGWGRHAHELASSNDQPARVFSPTGPQMRPQHGMDMHLLQDRR